MPLNIIRQDLTKMEVDAVVNATNSAMLPGGGLDAAIHAAAGPKLDAACRRAAPCPAGQARLTRGYGLPCRYVIHTVGPVWQGGERGERALLKSCYASALALAARKRCHTVACPVISAGAFGYPKAEAMRAAAEAIGEFLETHEMEVFLVVFGREDFRAGSGVFAEIQSYIDDHYVETAASPFRRGQSMRACMEADMAGNVLSVEDTLPRWSAPKPVKAVRAEKATAPRPAPPTAFFAPSAAAPVTGSLDQALRNLDESFSQALLRMIDERGMTDAQCYKKANIDRKLFSKIRGDVNYRPSKTTAIAFAVALELPLGETSDFLRKAGYALSHSNKFDVIIEYFISRGSYDIFEINEALFAFDQSLLGG